MGSKNKGHKHKTKNKNRSETASDGGEIIKDARFAFLHTDPRFQTVPKHKSKVVIDSRFGRMFTDKRFASSSAPLDKRGKRKEGNSQNSLRHYYHLDENEEEEEKRKKDVASEADDTEESDSSGMLEKDSDGEPELEEESSESGSTTEEEDVDIDFEDGEPEIQEENIPMIEKETWRLAVVNMDWRHVKLVDLELKEFLASDESESDDDENEETIKDQSDKKNKKRDLYRALLQSGDGSDGDGEEDGQDMEVTFNTGLEDISKRILEKKDKEAETVWEAYLRKRREKKKAKKNKSKHSSDDESDESDMEAAEEADDFFIEEPSLKKSKKGRKQNEDMEKEAEASRAELELLLTDDNGADTDLKGYNLKAKKAKGKKKREVLDAEKIPVVDDDPRFSAFFTSPLYALDPTDPQFKRSATYARQVAKKLQKGEREELAAEDTKIPTDDPEMNEVECKNYDILPSKEKHNLSSMVRSVKMNLKQVQVPSDRKVSKKSASGMGGKKEQHQVHAKKKAKNSNK